MNSHPSKEQKRTAGDSSKRRAGRLLVWLMLAGGLLAAMPYLTGVPPAVGTITATALFLLFGVLILYEAAHFPVRLPYEVIGLMLGGGLWEAVGLLAEHYSAWRPLLSALGSLCFLGACLFFGRLLSLLIRERNLLLPVAVVVGLADIFTVTVGPTHTALTHAPQLVRKLSVGIPKIGSARGEEGGRGLSYVATAGLGDFIFMAFFLTAARRFNLRLRQTAMLIFGLVLLAMAIVLGLPHIPALPLLPFVAGGFLLANVGAFQLSATERRDMWIGLALFLLLLGGLAVWLHKH